MSETIKKPTADDVRKAVKDDGIEFLFANFVDMHARPSAKLIPAEHLEDLLEDGAGFAGFAAGDIGQQPNDPDMIAMPDPGSFTKLPWKPNVGWFASNVTVEGEEHPYCPRTILQHQMKRCEDTGYQFKIGYELEYFLVRKTEDGSIEIADQLDDLEQPCYDIRALTRSFDFVSEVDQERQLARLGPVRHRPRGRQRPVRAELGARGSAHELATARSSTATWSRRWRRSAG